MSSIANDTTATSRDELVNHLEIPDDIPTLNFTWTEMDSVLDNSLVASLDSIESGPEDTAALSIPFAEAVCCDGRGKMATGSSFRGMTDTASYPLDPWVEMKMVLDKFPKDYLDGMRRLLNEKSTVLTSTDTEKEYSTISPTDLSFEKAQWLNELTEGMKDFFVNDCVVFSADDQSLKTLDKALQSLNGKADPDHSPPGTASTEDVWWRRSVPYEEFSVSPPAQHLLRAMARVTEYELAPRHQYNEERCRQWLEDNFLSRIENI